MNKVYFSAIWALAQAQIVRGFRDKTALFFSFLFPLIFLFVFGALSQRNSGVKFDVAVIDHSQGAVSTKLIAEAEKAGVIKVDHTVKTLGEARLKIGRSRLDSVLEFPEGFGAARNGVPGGTLNVYYQQGNPQGGQALAAIMQGIFDELNEQVTGSTRPFTVARIAAATPGLRSFDYIFSGLLGYSILSLGIFGMANTFPSYKKSGLLRRIRVAPISTAQLVIATGIRYLVTGLISLVLMVLVAIGVFHFSMKGSYFDLLLFAIFGIIMIFGIGLAIGGWAKNEDQATPLANIIALPLMFLSGVFFPRFLMPEWLQGITGYLPLSPVIDGFRAITAEGTNLFGLGHEFALMTIWTILIYALAIRLFRWE
jgi:ABC-2 type transport system permease protein